jgi:hypothetical protein
MIPSKDERKKTGFEQLLSVMPEGWEEKAKELWAFTRGRAIKSIVDYEGGLIPICVYLGTRSL